MVVTFLTEPGIIPRNHPDFQEKKNQNENLPRIMKERRCKTCNIYRPPKSSHCRICNNCVEEFDHHCVFISNCIGKRNHKYFYYFLITGSSIGLYVLILNLRLFYYVFFTHWKETTSYVIHKNPYLHLFCLILIIFSLYFIFICYFEVCAFVPGVIGFVVIFYKFWQNMNSKDRILNPWCFISLIGDSILWILNFSSFVTQTYFISRGTTIKEDDSMKKEYCDRYFDLEKNNQKILKIYSEYFARKSIAKMIINIWNFLNSPIPESKIVYERDLIQK
jgi:hypothetical protein